ncbi:MAG: 3-oxoacyl-ACP reductase FabG [Verrucomicrobia bacterium]|nr:3-oxoacyl-ACP reductase FabG [Verrucomicrobiota bacterium]
MHKLDGQVAIVTGAARGIGRGIALVLAEQGADVVVNDLSVGTQPQEVVALITGLGRRALAVKADVSMVADVERLFQATLEHFGRLDILVNNAGTSQAKDIFQIETADWERLIRTNLTSCFLCSQAAMRIMARQKSGRIVNISSVVGHQGALFGHVHYAATKSGMLGMTRTLARTGAPLGITVNAVAPGCIETELLHETLSEKGVEEMRGKIPLGLGTPRDVGLAVAFLCSEGGRYITGATLDVNGGLYMR